MVLTCSKCIMICLLPVVVIFFLIGFFLMVILNWSYVHFYDLMELFSFSLRATIKSLIKELPNKSMNSNSSNNQLIRNVISLEIPNTLRLEAHDII